MITENYTRKIWILFAKSFSSVVSDLLQPLWFVGQIGFLLDRVGRPIQLYGDIPISPASLRPPQKLKWTPPGGSCCTPIADRAYSIHILASEPAFPCSCLRVDVLYHKGRSTMIISRAEDGFTERIGVFFHRHCIDVHAPHGPKERSFLCRHNSQLTMGWTAPNC